MEALSSIVRARDRRETFFGVPLPAVRGVGGLLGVEEARTDGVVGEKEATAIP